MTEGKVEIFLSHKEPENKNILWLRPELERDGYCLLYFGAGGWTPLIPAPVRECVNPLLKC